MFNALTFQNVMGALSVFIALIAYGVYGWQTIMGQTRPHPLSWLIFAVLTGTGFWIQWNQGAGAGSWVMGVTAAICLLLSILSVWKGERTFPWYEWAFLVLAAVVFSFYIFSTKPALVATALTRLANVIGFGPRIDQLLVPSVSLFTRYGPAISAVAATIVDVLGYGPTITKAWFRPYADSPFSFAANSLKFIPSLFAMDSISIATFTYPAMLVVVNAAVAVFIWLRRKSPSIAVKRL